MKNIYFYKSTPETSTKMLEQEYLEQTFNNIGSKYVIEILSKLLCYLPKKKIKKT